MRPLHHGLVSCSVLIWVFCLAAARVAAQPTGGQVVAGTATFSGGPGGLTALRDRALLLVGWAGAFRRSELVALEVADVEALPTGALRVTVRRSKTDQEGRGFVKVIGRARDPQACPVECLRRWREAATSTGNKSNKYRPSACAGARPSRAAPARLMVRMRPSRSSSIDDAGAASIKA